MQSDEKGSDSSLGKGKGKHIASQDPEDEPEDQSQQDFVDEYDHKMQVGGEDEESESQQDSSQD